MKKLSTKILFVVFILFVIGFFGFGFYSWYHKSITTQTFEQKTLQSEGFDVQEVDSNLEMSMSQIVSKNGITYELLCAKNTTRQVEKEETYECLQLDYNKPIYKTKEMYIKYNESCKDKVHLNSTDFCLINIEYISGYEYKVDNCIRKVIIDEVYCAEKTGTVKVADRIISKEGYYCGAGECDEWMQKCSPTKTEEYPCEKEITTPIKRIVTTVIGNTTSNEEVIEYQKSTIQSVCKRLVENKDCKDNLGGSNHDGICTAGEVCVKYESLL